MNQIDPDILVGDSKAPNLERLDVDSLKTPHVMIYQIPIGDPHEGEGYGGGQGQEWIRLQIAVAALLPRQVRRTAAAAADYLVSRNPADKSQWLTDITVAGHAVIDRKYRGVIPIDNQGVSAYGGRLVDFLVQETA